jgi:hypothetical protein
MDWVNSVSAELWPMASGLPAGALELIVPWSAGIVADPVVAFEPQPASVMTAARAAAEKVIGFFM